MLPFFLCDDILMYYSFGLVLGKGLSYTMRSLLAIIRPDADAPKGLQRAHRAWLYGWMTLMGVGIGLISMMLAAYAYAPLNHLYLFLSYFRLPLLAALNLFVPVLLVYLGFFLFRRPWAAYLTAAVPCLALAFGSYYKTQLRGDPVLATDLRILRTAGGIVGHYTLELTKPILAGIAGALIMLLFSLLLMRKEPLRVRTRVIGVLACLVIALGAYFTVYTDADIYTNKTANNSFINPWSDVEVFVSKGSVYPFLYSVQEMFPDPPEGYSEKDALAALAPYEDADIPAEEKVTVVGIMLEAFCDLTDYPVLADIPAVAEVYAPLHELEARCLSGRLLTNIFAGGTTDTEWGFLTGYSRHEDFRRDTDSYVWYFKSQGYNTLYRHPGYGWFYNRQNVNEYLGFDESVFTDSGFGELVDPTAAVFHSDAVLMDYLLRDLDAQQADGDPLFLFSVSYQNHGPYSSESCAHEYVTPAQTGWSQESCCILNNYLAGVSETIGELIRMADTLEQRDEPVVFVFFGDHKPWLGNGSSVYAEMGIDLDTAALDGFYNYYATPYAIYANSAAKRTLGGEFTGEGGDFSPCYLMQRLFDACGWEGSAFMQLQRETYAVTPLLHVRGWFLKDGVLTGNLDGEEFDLYHRYLYAQYYREQHFTAAG